MLQHYYTLYRACYGDSVAVFIEFILFGMKHLTGYCQHKHGNETHGSTECGDFHDWVVNCQLMTGCVVEYYICVV